MQLNNIAIHKKTFSYIKSSSILSVSEGSNDLIFTGYNGMSTNQYNNRIVKEFCLLLVVYIHCFCLPTFSFVINIFSGFGESIGSERSEMACIEENVSFKEDKDFLSKLLCSFREQVEYNILTRNLYQKAVKL